jgi:hypothetical protein
MVRLYEVDALFPPAGDEEFSAFAKRFPHLRWPNIHKSLFIEGTGGRGLATCLDIYHPVRRIFEEHIDRKQDPRVTAALYEWAADDPLRDVFLAQFGAYPAPEEIQIDYRGMVERNLKAEKIDLPVDASVPWEPRRVTPAALSRFDLSRDRSPNWGHPGLYVGTATDFIDIVNFWNLRAASVRVMFFDPKHDARLGEMGRAYVNLLRERPREAGAFDADCGIWSKEGVEVDLKALGLEAFEAGRVTRMEIGETMWNGQNLAPPLAYIEDVWVLGSLSESEGAPSITFELREKPFYDEHELHTQTYVASIGVLAYYGEDELVTFNYPFLPELNDFYRREALDVHEVRSDRNGLGVIMSVRAHSLTVHAILSRSLVANLLGIYGMKCEVSEAGRIASRVIQQMGGVQGCRVLKIAGVRALIEKYKPSQPFTRGDATQIIGDVDPNTNAPRVDRKTGTPTFARYESLFIERREGPKLKPHHVFDYLVKRNVFRVGLKFACPNCELDSWTHLDDVATETTCEYCGKRFNVTPQLKDGSWAYRRSGLFGREDHQQGAIPVALTLQQLDTILHWESTFVTSMNLKSAGATIEPCETDFVLISENGPFDRLVNVAVGECKAPGGEISEEDVRNLAKVADAFPKDRIQTYIVFAKTAPFTSDEIARCRGAQPAGRRRVILLSDRELEPYFVYDWAAKEFEIDSSAISLQDLANTTHSLYFDPKPKRPAASPPPGPDRG